MYISATIADILKFLGVVFIVGILTLAILLCTSVADNDISEDITYGKGEEDEDGDIN